MLVPASQGLGHLTDAQARAVPPLPPLPQRSTIYDSHGNFMQNIYFGEDRSPVTLSQVPQKVIDAVLATEDREFFSHSGFYLRGIVRAFVRNVGSGSVNQGGSTITQQLVKNSLFPKGRPHTLEAKAHEAIYATRLEQSYSKRQILERYLNTIYFGEQAYGIQAAAERYFNKSVEQLGLVEGAMLAGLIANPSGYDPILHPQAARDRRHEVLRSMVETGSITSFEADGYDKAGLPKHVTRDAGYAATSYFLQAMEGWLKSGKNLASVSLGTTDEARSRLLYQGGLKITTTYDKDLTDKAEAAVTGAPLPDKANLLPLDAAIAVVDNSTGAVRAIANRTPFSQSHQFDAATNGSKGGKQPGSGFKTFTLAAALDAKYSAKDSSKGGSCHFDRPQATDNNYNVTSDVGGAPSLKTAIAQSVNCSFVNLEVSMGWGAKGPKKVASMANRLGLNKHFKDTDFVTSLTLGTIGVTPLGMATAYSTLASDGVRHDPVYVTKIVGPDGAVLFNRDSAPARPVLDPEIARTVTKLLTGVIKGGTAPRANIGRPAAGKTGTTTDGTDLWFTGYTPEYTASVWVGIENPTSTNRSLVPYVGEGGAFGGSVSAPIWANFMRAALDGKAVKQFTAPDERLWPSAECVSVDPPGRKPCYIYVAPPPTTPTTVGKAKPGKGTKPGKGGKGTTPTSTPTGTTPTTVKK